MSRAVAATIALISLPSIVAVVDAVRFKRANADDHSIVVAGQRREFMLHVPKTYDRTRPTALVLSFHGAGLWGQAQRRISQWDRVADREGFIVAYPSALAGRGPAAWRVEGGDPARNRDVQFVRALIDTLSARYNIDRGRIYANGFSNGGGMSYMLSCAMPDVIAAYGLVGAALTMNPQQCHDTRPAPAIVFHGTKDDAAPYFGGDSWVTPDERPFPNVPAFVANWARRNQCAVPPIESRVSEDVTARQYPRCARDATVAFYTIEGGGHTWPGSANGPEAFLGKSAMTIDASELMWTFFQHQAATVRKSP